jgi:hypothetical protein
MPPTSVCSHAPDQPVATAEMSNAMTLQISN